MKYRIFIYMTCLLALFSACSTENDVVSAPDVPTFPSDKDWTEELIDGASATVKGFEPGDAVSRTSLAYDGQSLIFGWKEGDKLGLYPTAKDMSSLLSNNSPKQGMKKAEGTTEGDSTEGDSTGGESTGGESTGSDSTEGESSESNVPAEGLLPHNESVHPGEPNVYRVDPNYSVQSGFSCEETTSKTTKITNMNGSSDFFWDDVVRWSAYLPYKAQNEERGENYVKRYFSFAGQEQKDLAEIGEYFDYEDRVGNPAEHLNKYHISEVNASEHLGNFDVMISPETKWEQGVRINFQMRHVGAVARIYLKVGEENLTIKDVKLICDKKIFYENGSFTLFSHPYKDDEANNYGVDLVRGSEGCQIKTEGDPVNMLQLDFANTCVTKKTGSGNYGPYVVAYLMMYPITYTPATDGNLFAYVTATDQEGKEVHYVSEPLSGKTMESGKYYQWTSVTHPDDGLYPIELTATLLPWQDIVGAGIETDLEK